MFASCVLTSSYGIAFFDGSIYRSIVGAMQYLTLAKLEIAFSTNRVSQFMKNPFVAH